MLRIKVWRFSFSGVAKGELSLNWRNVWRLGLAALVVGIVAIVGLNLAPERRDLREPIPHLQAVSEPQFLRTMDGIFGGNRTAAMR